MDSDCFQNYCEYYDLLYKDKDYEAEVNYLHNLIQTYLPGACSILEFGSGTGKHGLLLKNMGYQIYGIEKSPLMAEKAIKSGYDCKIADITLFNLNKSFNIILALFHVMSYMTENSQIIDAFSNAANHLIFNGIFIFDIWYLPSILREMPENRVKKVHDDNIEIIRWAFPNMRFNRNIVDVIYKFKIKDKKKNSRTEFEETHSMRYFSIPEIEFFADITGFKVIRVEESYLGNSPSEKTWSVTFILKKK